MKSIQYDRYGGPEELRLADIERPKAGRGQICVKVLAASVNPMDWVIRRGQVKMMSGSKFPRGLGHDFAGMVEAVGDGVTRLKVGDEVFGAASLKEAGAFAEALVTEEKNVFIKPQALSFEVAGALPIVSMTAWTALIEKAKVRAGQSVFVSGCLGGVGRAGVQVALLKSASVVGSCAASGRTEAFALGVSEVFDYRGFDPKTLARRFDIVFDTAGVLTPGQCQSMLKKGGVALHIVNTPGKIIRSLLSPRHKTVFGAATPDSMAAISAAAIAGRLTPKIAGTVSLNDAIAAIIALEKTGAPKGKLIVAPAA